MTADPVVVTLSTLQDWTLPGPGADKDAHGRVLVVGGSRSTPGAVRLAAEAAFRAGAGKVRIATVDSATTVLGLLLPESAVVPLPATPQGHVDPAAAPELVSESEGVDAVLIGPGLTGKDEIVELVGALLSEIRTPVVLDALASAFLTAEPEGAQRLEGKAVLTVNTSELAKTDGCSEDAVDEEGPAAVAARVAARSGVVVLHGGTEKHVVTPAGDTWVVRGGGPGLGVSGSGDVQAGLVAGLLARGAEPAQAAVWGAFLHAQAGERLCGTLGQLGFLASELPGQVPYLLDLVR